MLSSAVSKLVAKIERLLDRLKWSRVAIEFKPHLACDDIELLRPRQFSLDGPPEFQFLLTDVVQARLDRERRQENGSGATVRPVSKRYRLRRIQ